MLHYFFERHLLPFYHQGIIFNLVRKIIRKGLIKLIFLDENTPCLHLF
jgi:hypothetical protein